MYQTVRPLIVMTEYMNSHTMTLGMEAVKTHLKDDPYILIDDGKLTRPLKNERFPKSHIFLWKTRFFKILDQINFPKERVICVEQEPIPDDSIPNVQTLKDLKNYCYQGVPYGLMIASLLISKVRDHYVDVNKHQRYIQQVFSIGYTIYAYVEQLLKKLKIDSMILPRARCEQHPLITLCEKNKLTYFSVELDSTMSSYVKFKNALPHSLEYTAQEISKAYQNKRDEWREIGSRWFKEQRYDCGSHQICQMYYIKHQKKGALPNLDRNKRNIAIFTSSIDEYETIPGWENPFFRDENAGIECIMKAFLSKPEFHFCLRVHPHLNRVKNSQIRAIQEMNFPNLTVIGPEESIDSYALVENVEKVIVFCSTIGSEACFWGKPVISLGRTFYDATDCSYKPKDIAEVFTLIEKNLEAKPKDEANKYGYWMMTRGHKFVHYPYVLKDLRNYINTDLEPKLRLDQKVYYKILKRLDRAKNSFSKHK